MDVIAAIRWLNLNCRSTVTRASLASITLVCLMSCGGGGSKSTTSSSSRVVPVSSSSVASSSVVPVSSSSVASSVASVQLQGVITFDLVTPVMSASKSYLDYTNIKVMPARNITVELLDSLNKTIATTTTDNSGFYEFATGTNKSVKVRARVAMANANYRIEVKDNTANAAAYVLDGSLSGSGANATQTRNLHASLGWDNNSLKYTGERQSAPFAILDTIYNSLNLVLKADSTVKLPTLVVYWSPKNVASAGDYSQGLIGSSVYSTAATAIYVLGDEDDDTDEFDSSVIQHEFGHFIEHKLSRTESIGGTHYIGQPVDMRVAFGEGFGNAFASMSSGDPIYKDTNGITQSTGFGFSVESNRQGGGYYNEGVVHSLLWDIFDGSPAEAGDNINVGFAPILATLRHSDYLNFDGVTSLFSFLSVFKTLQPDGVTALNTLLFVHNVFGTDAYGTGEKMTGGAAISLPIYQRLSAGQNLQACSDNKSQDSNGIDVTRFILLDIADAGTYTINAQRVSGIQPSNPNFAIFKQGVWGGERATPTADTETWMRAFNAGVYLLTVVEAANADEDDNTTGGLVCFNVTLTRN